MLSHVSQRIACFLCAERDAFVQCIQVLTGFFSALFHGSPPSQQV